MGKDWYDGCLNDQEWRLNHLYFISTKEDGIQRFKLNWAQTELFHNLHTRNTILKARQLGMSTFTSIMILDRCLFENGFQAGIIDRTEDDGKEKMQKIALAYDFLENPPETTKDHVEDAEDRKNIAAVCRAVWKQVKADIGAVRATFSSKGRVDNVIRVATTLRGGTLNFLHVSEYGYIANNFPLRAKEIKTGAMEAVAKNNVVVIESTHEGGKTGENYRIIKNAMENQGRELEPLDFRFFFFSWHRQREYRIEKPEPLGRTELDGYFKELANMGIELDNAQKRWYLAKYKVLGDSIKQEYPSTPDEALSSQIEGAIYGNIISRIRSQGQVAASFETDPYAPLYVSWDIGMGDNTSLWLFQVGASSKYHVLDYYTSSGKAAVHYINKVREWEREHGALIEMHLLPHDASHRDLIAGLSFEQCLQQAKFRTLVVPRTPDVWQGINATRSVLPSCIFHKRCSEQVWDEEIQDNYVSGLECLENYRTAPSGANGVIKAAPLHDQYSHGADAFRMFAEALAIGWVSKHARTGGREPRNWASMVQRPEPKRGLAKGVPNWI